MSSVRLSDIPRTTSFRLALLFLGLVGTGAVVLFGFMYVETAGFLARDVDSGLAREVSVRAPKSAAELERLFNERAPLDPEGRRPFALFDRAGSWMAGNRATLPEPLPPLDKAFDFTLSRADKPVSYRGFLHQLPSGELFLVGEDITQIHHFQRLLAASMLSGGLVVLVLGLVGGMMVGASAAGRIESVTQAIERIIDGDLSGRLPSGRRGGDLNRLIRVVNRMLDETERLMREVKGVTEDIAHDLRTPLTRLLAGLERVRRRARSVGEYEVAVDDAIAETKSVLSTFAALLRIAEVEAGARRAGFTTLDLVTLAADVAELYEPVAESKGIGFSLETGGHGGPAEIPGDPSLMFEAISNLVDNAIKFTPAGGRILLRSFNTADRVGIEVTDTGPGIPEAECEAVLRRFHRVEKCRTITPGSGLGLSLVAAVAKLHGLHLAIEDAQPGCRVRLWRDGATMPAA